MSMLTQVGGGWVRQVGLFMARNPQRVNVQAKKKDKKWVKMVFKFHFEIIVVLTDLSIFWGEKR